MTTTGGDDITIGEGATFNAEVFGKVEHHHHGPVHLATAALPPSPPTFTGRTTELDALLKALRPRRRRGSATTPVLICALSGLGGIGKTTLALQAAHTATAKRWFPGGTLFFNLRGYDDTPATADQALIDFLHALGVRGTDLPSTTTAQYNLYRSLLANRRKPMLLVFDNASDPAQITPLLPGATHHRVLVTSRVKLPDLNARLLSVGELPPAETVALLDRVVRTANPADTRIPDGPEAAARLATLCGHLPLALQISAAVLAADPTKPVTELTDELAAAPDHLADVHAAFDLSYRHLPDDQALLLRLLALAPGPDVSNDAVAALTGDDTPPLAALVALEGAHLIERGGTRSRWRMHDLVRNYAGGLAEGSEAAAARGRVLAFYYRWAGAADDHMRWIPGNPLPALFTGRSEAFAWFDAERANLVAAAKWSTDGSPEEARVAVDVALSLGEYLIWRRYFDDLDAVSRAAQHAAQPAGDSHREARAWNNLGRALRAAGLTAEAVDALTKARDLHEVNGDQTRAAAAWNNLGLALREGGRPDEAIVAHSRARSLYQALTDRNREGMAWNNLGIALLIAGRTAEAIDAHTHARALYQETGDRIREGRAWHNLGRALQTNEQVQSAIAAYGKAVELYAEFDNWYEAAASLRNLALVYQSTDRLPEARTTWLRAADAYTHANAPTEAAAARNKAHRARLRHRALPIRGGS